MKEDEPTVTATQAIRMLGWTRKYFYRVLHEIEERESIEINKSHGFPTQRCIPVSLVTALKSNWKKAKHGGCRKTIEKPGFPDDD